MKIHDDIKDLIKHYERKISRLQEVKDMHSEKDKYDPIDKALLIHEILIYKRITNDLVTLLHNGIQE